MYLDGPQQRCTNEEPVPCSEAAEGARSVRSGVRQRHQHPAGQCGDAASPDPQRDGLACTHTHMQVAWWTLKKRYV